MAVKTDGAAGPLGIDAYGWNCLLASLQRESQLPSVKQWQQWQDKFVNSLLILWGCRPSHPADWWLWTNILAPYQMELGKYCGALVARPY